MTFAIFSYNQEEFIKEAIESALLQDYNPMEIILSDDSSSDLTFKIIQDVARTYIGPKKVKVNQTKSNMGTLLHLNEVGKLATGQLIIVAHGDDVSKKNRTKVLVEHWLNSHAWGLFSKYDRILSNGKVTVESEDPRNLFPKNYRLKQYLNDPMLEIVYGPVSAYDKRIFNYLDLNIEDYILSEDGVVSVLLKILDKKVEFIDEALVFYRSSEKSISNSEKERKVNLNITVSDEMKIERFSKSHANRCLLFLRWNQKFKQENNIFNVKNVSIDFNRHMCRSNWRNMSLNYKLYYVLNNFHYQELKWALPRLMPIQIFYRFKTFFKKILI